MSDSIRIDSASTNNLKELSCELPRGSIVGVTGPSGSGKSSLVFGTLWREARRRLLAPVFASAEALLDPPAPVRGISGLSFPVALFPGRAGRSYLPSVATLGGFFDDLSELFLHFGQAHCVRCDAALDEHTRKSIADSLELSGAERAAVLIPVAGCDASARVEAARSYLAKGFTRAYVGGEYLELEQLLPAENEEVGVLVDAIKLSTGGFRPRLFEALAIALRYSPRALLVGEVSGGSNVNYWFSPKAYCGECGNVQTSRDPELFDYYKRRSACEGCLGSGVQASPAQNSVFDVTVPLLKGGVLPWRARTLLPSSAELLRWKRSLKLKGTTMLSDLAPQLQFRALFGAAGTTRFPVFGLSPRSAESDLLTSGIAGTLVARYRSAHDPALRKTLARFIEVTECAMCCGARVRAEVGARRIFGRSFSEVFSSTISDVAAWLDAVSSEYTKGSEIRARLLRRLRGLEKLGIGYLTPSRAARTLSGGEYQRVEIARELDSPLAGVLYLLDEPSVGLHPLDSRRLAAELAGLKAHDATVVVVDHDAEVLRACDMILELGPAGGACGGEILFQGTSGEYFSKRRPKGVMRTADSPRPSGQKLTATGLAMRNLRGISLSIPCGALVGICGVSGSGKSTALFECLAPALEALISRRRRSNKAGGSPALTADEKRRWCISEVRGLEQFERLSVLPRFAGFFGSRSTVAGASGVAQLLRKLYVLSIESRVRGLRLSDFTLSQTHEISPVVLNLGWKGVKYGEVLNCTVSEAARHFQAIPRLGVRLITLDRLGLGYLSLSQPVRTLSTGEQQRIRLAVELASGRTGNALFLLDEPTRGLSAGETALLVTLFRDLVRRGHTVVCIEHEPELLAQADYLIEFGPGGGPSGGQIIAEGSPDAFKAHGDSVIGRFL